MIDHPVVILSFVILLPLLPAAFLFTVLPSRAVVRGPLSGLQVDLSGARSEEHTSELQSPCNLVCRLLLEKKQDACLCSRAGIPGSGPPQATTRSTRSSPQPTNTPAVAAPAGPRRSRAGWRRGRRGPCTGA